MTRADALLTMATITETLAADPRVLAAFHRVRMQIAATAALHDQAGEVAILYLAAEICASQPE